MHTGMLHAAAACPLLYVRYLAGCDSCTHHHRYTPASCLCNAASSTLLHISLYVFGRRALLRPQPQPQPHTRDDRCKTAPNTHHYTSTATSPTPLSLCVHRTPQLPPPPPRRAAGEHPPDGARRRRGAMRQPRAGAKRRGRRHSSWSWRR